MASDKIKDSLIDIQEKWSLDDILDAHDLLDYIEEINEQAAKKTKK